MRIIKEEKEDLIGEPDLSREDERGNDKDKEKDKDEQVTTAAIAGYTLPLGASNNKSTPKKRQKQAKKSYGGEGKDPDTDWYK